ncbi:CHAT domain-containing protein [Actinomycetospora atypica]|uniref:CHAT domain-containing protein n=1 Tax=Actinomycetospora atypica TaxID=1290095 RepID=A0ABV9YJQ6_9PSEU
MGLESFDEVLRALLRDQWRPGGPAPATAGSLTAAAAALGAGEPRRAARILDALAPGDDADLAEVLTALRALAGVLGTAWFPGGGPATREPGHDDEVVVAPDIASTESRTRVLVTVAGHLLAALPLWRDIATGGPEAADVAIGQAQLVLEQLSTLDEPTATAAAALALADVAGRAGQGPMGDAALEIARSTYELLGDRSGVAACDLAAGDRAAAPGSHPELLGERLAPGQPSGTGTVPDPQTAERHWAEAELGYRTAGAPRGLAAVALRRAGALVTQDDPVGAVAALDDATTLAEGTGDGALSALIAVHRALALVQAGERPDVSAIGAAVAAWALGNGSRSFARGLARLCVARAARWRDDDVRGARLAHRLAESITTALGGTPEAAALREDQADRYVAANYRRAAFVLADAEVEASRWSGDDRDGLAWGRLVTRVAAASRDAQGLRDGAAVERVGEHANWLAGTPPQGPMAEAVHSAMSDTLDGIRAEGSIFGPLYRALTLRSAGDPERAVSFFDEALEAARQTGPFPTLVVLGQMRRFDEAVTVLEQIDASLPADASAALWTRLKRFDRAHAVLVGLPEGELPAGGERPWEAPGLLAEIQLGLGDTAGAAVTAAVAVARFEEHLAGLGLDVFRTMATDDFAVAGLYTTAIRAHTRLATDPAAGPTDRAVDLAGAFELSDRCRAGSLTDLFGRSVRTRVPPAVRRWQQTGALLARAVEQAGDEIGEPGAAERVQRTVRDAERALDEAEEILVMQSPDEVATRRRLPTTPSLASIRSRLAPGTLLLQFHAFDDELVAWAVTSESARVVHQDVATAELTAEARGWHRALAQPDSTAADREASAGWLADLLLRPWTDELAEHRRVVIVPHGPLAVLPFHAVPWAGDTLGAQWTTSVLPAASLVPEVPRLGAAVPATGDDVLLVGNPSFATERRLEQLPGTRTEALAVGRLRQAAPLLADQATRDAVLDRLPGARVLHLATHGVLREASPYSAELALAGTSSLTLPDLVGADSGVELAVLSACDSGRGRATAAGDLVGLTRALIAAGADELVVSLWPVDDQLACLTMVALHEELQATSSVGAALERARTRLRTLTREEAGTWYRDLERPTTPETDPTPRRARRSVRDADPEAPPPDAAPDPAHPFAWAPFVHIGTS